MRNFADDTCLIVHLHTTEEMTLSMDQEVEVARQWMQANKLTINATKSTLMVIFAKKTSTILNINLSCKGCPIPNKSSVRYRGIVLDNKFIFNEYTAFSVQRKDIQRKVTCAVGVIAKLKLYFPKNILLKVYHALRTFPSTLCLACMRVRLQNLPLKLVRH